MNNILIQKSKMSDFKTTENMNVKKEDTGFDEKKEEVVGLDD